MDSTLHPVAQNTLLYSVVVPARNEEQNVGRTLHALAEALRADGVPFELVVVNDNSTDDTARVVEALRDVISEIRLVHNLLPPGFGRAVRCGLEHTQGEAIAIVMADCSDAPADVVACYRMLERGYDCVFGSRFLPGSRVTGYPPFKRIVNRVANRFLQLVFWTRHNDLTNAFKVYRHHVIAAVSSLRADHFDITVELSLSALARGYRIAAMPISWTGRTWGHSKLRLREVGWRYLRTVLRIRFQRFG